MYSLIRFFGKEKYANQFLAGDLFMNSIGHFWKIGLEVQEDQKVRGDHNEGVYEVLSVDALKDKYGFDAKAFFGEHIIAPVANRAEAYKYVHLLCLLLLPYDNEYKEVEKVSCDMAKFGKYAVKINNVEKFVDRLFTKLWLNKIISMALWDR